MEKLQQKVYFFVILACFAAMLSSCSNASGGGGGGGGDKPSKPSEITYTVEHWQQNILDDDYTKVEADTQTLTGTANKKTAAQAKSYTGFTAKDPEQVTLTEDKNTVIKIYYDRKVTAITFNANGGKFYSGSLEPITINRKYGATFSIGMGEELWPSRDNYEFRGWAYNSNATSCDFGPNLYFEVKDTTPSAVTLYAIWRVDSNFNTGLFFVSGGNVEIVPEGGSFHAKPEIDGTYTYEWYLNNDKLSSNTEYCTIDVSSLAEGVYALVVKATSSTGIVYVSQYSLPVYGEAQ